MPQLPHPPLKEGVAGVESRVARLGKSPQKIAGSFSGAARVAGEIGGMVKVEVLACPA